MYRLLTAFEVATVDYFLEIVPGQLERVAAWLSTEEEVPHNEIEAGGRGGGAGGGGYA